MRVFLLLVGGAGLVVGVHHLAVLERANVLQSRREGKSALYSVHPGVVLAALDALRTRTRQGFDASAYRDEAVFTRRLEAAYRAMFARWLA